MYFFFFNDTATTEIYTLSLHDALPIFPPLWDDLIPRGRVADHQKSKSRLSALLRSEEHTSELQSLAYLVCRLLLEKKWRKKSRRRPTCGFSSNGLIRPPRPLRSMTFAE